MLSETLLSKVIQDFKIKEVPRFERLERYYRVKNEILRRTAKDDKPNNKLAHGFAKYITKMATGYFMGKGVRYLVKDVDTADDGETNALELEEYKTLLTAVLDHNYTVNTNFELAKEASKKGIAYELLYIDEKGRLRTQKMDAQDFIPIYSPRVGEFLEAAIRVWTEKDSTDSRTDYAALYTDTEVLTYARASGSSTYRLLERQPHMLGDIPVIVYWNNEERTGDYEDVISLIDAYDKAQSDTANDSEYFADAYLYIVGAGGGLETGAGEDADEDTANAYRTLRRERVMHLDENGQAGWLVKDVNDSALQNYKNRLYDDIFFLSQVPALSDESFAGNLTGVAIRYKLIGLEELTTEKEHKFLAAQKKKIRIITDYINAVNGKRFNPDDVQLKTERNVIDNLTEIIENVLALGGVVSQKTRLSLLPFVADVNEELEQIQQEESGGKPVDDNGEALQKFLRGSEKNAMDEV